MVKRRYHNFDDLPLFADDEMLGEVILGFDRRREFAKLAPSLEPVGLPRMNPLYRGRYVPAVRAFFETQHGRWQQKRTEPYTRPSYLDDPGNQRSPYRIGKVRVQSPDGPTWIEDAKPTDPPFVPKRKLTPRTPPEPT